MALTQEHRRLAISSPLGEDVLLFRRMTVSENLGELFSCDLEIAIETHHECRIASATSDACRERDNASYADSSNHC